MPIAEHEGVPRHLPFPLRLTPARDSSIRLGFLALSDCAPLLVAHALGYFEDEGVTVTLHREAGWASIREKILYRQLDGAHAVVGMGLSLRLGLNGLSCRAITPLVLNLHGNAITLSLDLWRRGAREAESLAKLIHSSCQRPLTFGIVARSSSHHFFLRQWLARAGVDPDHEVRMVILPPPHMPRALAAGLIDGFCAGDPWNSLAIAQGTGWCAALSSEFMPGHPDKILLTTEDFAAEEPRALAGIVRALEQACRYCAAPDNRERVVGLLHNSGHFRVNRAVLARALTGPFDDGVSGQREVKSFYLFHGAGVNEPTSEKAEWTAAQFARHGLCPSETTTRLREEALACFRPDLFHSAFPKPARRKRAARVSVKV